MMISGSPRRAPSDESYFPCSPEVDIEALFREQTTRLRNQVVYDFIASEFDFQFTDEEGESIEEVLNEVGFTDMEGAYYAVMLAKNTRETQRMELEALEARYERQRLEEIRVWESDDDEEVDEDTLLWNSIVQDIREGKYTYADPEAWSCARTQFSDPEIDDGICCICMSNTADCEMKPCGHSSFCMDCAKELVNRNRKTTCPLCRANVFYLRKKENEQSPEEEAHEFWSTLFSNDEYLVGMAYDFGIEPIAFDFFVEFHMHENSL
jgi:hypothetical protein